MGESLARGPILRVEVEVPLEVGLSHPSESRVHDTLASSPQQLVGGINGGGPMLGGQPVILL